LPSNWSSQSRPATGLHWRTAWEDGILGFNVYKVEGGERVHLNERLILAGQQDYVFPYEPGVALYEIEKLTVNLEVSVIARLGNAGPIGQPVVDLVAKDGSMTFTTEGGVNSYLVFGLNPEFQVLDITEADKFVALYVEKIQVATDTAAYFSWHP